MLEPENKNKMLQGLLADIFGLSSKLLYYDVIKTKYVRTRSIFRKGCSNISILGEQGNRLEGAGGRQKTIFLKRSAKKKTMKSEKESDLIQGGSEQQMFF